MAIRRLKVSNFRSFNELDVELGDFNVLIGANASGKSNFIEIFRFLRDIQNFDLTTAVAWQGGKDFVQNLQLGSSKPLSIGYVDRQDFEYEGTTFPNPQGNPFTDDLSWRKWNFQVKELQYAFSLHSSEQVGRPHIDGWHIEFDRVLRKFHLHSIHESESNSGKETRDLGEGSFSAWWNANGLQKRFEVDSSVNNHFEHGLFSSPLLDAWYPQERLFLESVYFSPLLTGVPYPPYRTIDELAIYNIDASASQQAQNVKAPATLTEGATNLAPILDRILTDVKEHESLLNLVKFLLPFVDDIGVQNLTDRSMLLDLSERFAVEHKIPASLISEGTIAAIALVVILYFESSPLVILDDPDRGMHPKLMSRVVEMMKEASKNKQIIVTTHHPEMVRFAGVENLLLVSRDKDGFSQISRPADKTMVKQFLESNVGIDQLYVDDLLEV